MRPPSIGIAALLLAAQMLGSAAAGPTCADDAVLRVAAGAAPADPDAPGFQRVQELASGTRLYGPHRLRHGERHAFAGGAFAAAHVVGIGHADDGAAPIDVLVCQYRHDGTGLTLVAELARPIGRASRPRTHRLRLEPGRRFVLVLSPASRERTARYLVSLAAAAP